MRLEATVQVESRPDREIFKLNILAVTKITDGFKMTAQSPKRRSKIFFGWWTVLATGIITGWGWGSWGYGFSAYIKPLEESFGWTRAQTSIAYSMNRLEGGLEGPFGGILTDKYGPRAVNFVGMFMAGLGLCLLYFMNTLWQFILIWGFIVSLGFNLGMLGPLETALANWFVKKRGLAIGIARFSLAFSGAIVLPFMTYLLITYGWRTAFLIAGVITWSIGLPLTWFFVKPHRPEYYGLLPDGAEVVEKQKSNDVEAMIEAGMDYAREKVGEVEFSLRQLLKTSAFWVMIANNIFYRLAWSASNVHQIPYLTDIGIDPILAARVLGLMLFVSAPGRLLCGLLTDRIATKNLKYLYIISSALQITGFFFFMNAESLTTVYLFTILFGFGMGIRYSLNPLIRGRFWGRKAFATVQGTSAMLELPMAVFAPIYVGWVYDVTGSYISVFNQSLIAFIVGTFILFALKPPKPPEDITKVTEFL